MEIPYKEQLFKELFFDKIEYTETIYYCGTVSDASGTIHDRICKYTIFFDIKMEYLGEYNHNISKGWFSFNRMLCSIVLGTKIGIIQANNFCNRQLTDNLIITEIPDDNFKLLIKYGYDNTRRKI